jgi:predicted kinase
MRGLANVTLNQYLHRTGDLSGLAALPLFLSVRAAVRAHISAISARSTEPGRTRDELATAAESYLNLAQGLLAPPPPRLVAVGGLSGAGKSTLARALAPEIGRTPGAIILRSDLVRKELSGMAPLARLPQSAYRPDVTARVYATLRDRARIALGARHAVVVDAVHSTPEERDALGAVAEAAGARFDGLWLDAPGDAMAARIDGRKADASDSTIAVLRRQLGYDLGAVSWPRIEAGGDAAATLRAAQASLGR